MLSSDLKKAINTGAWSVNAQMVSDAVVNGATSDSQKAVEGAVNEALNTATPCVKESVQQLISRKRPHTGITTTIAGYSRKHRCGRLYQGIRVCGI